MEVSLHSKIENRTNKKHQTLSHLTCIQNGGKYDVHNKICTLSHDMWPWKWIKPGMNMWSTMLIFQEQAWQMFQSCWSCFAGFCKLSQLQFPPTLRILKPVSKRREALVVLTWMQGQAGTQHRSRTQHQGHRCSAGPPAEEFESPHDHPTKSLRMVKRSGLDCLVNLGEMGWNCLVADQTPCNPHPTKKKKVKEKCKFKNGENRYNSLFNPLILCTF